MSGTTTAASAVADDACFDDLGAEGTFESFKNPYTTSRTGNAAIYGVSSTSSVTDGTTNCTPLTRML